MNGFAINPGRWFFDLFAYETHGGHEDYGWLLDWPSPYPLLATAHDYGVIHEHPAVEAEQPKAPWWRLW